MQKSSCPDCGTAPISHALTKIANFIDYMAERIFGPIEHFLRRSLPFLTKIRWDLFFYYTFALTYKLGLTTRVYEPAVSDSSRTRYLWSAAKKHGVEMYKIGVFGRTTEITAAKHAHRQIMFMSLPRPVGPASESFSWMDNKEIVREKFHSTGIPVPKGAVCFSLSKALNVFETLSSTVVVKPVLGSRSRHTHTHIQDKNQLVKAFNSTKEISPWVVVEEELQGLGYRITLVGGKIAGILRREPPHVIGDGTLTVQALVEKENARPERHGPVFHSLPTGENALRQLGEQSLNWQSIPSNGQFVLLSPRHVMNRTPGGSTTDYTDLAHPDNVALFTKIGETLNDPLVGVDFIIEDMAASWKVQPRCGVNECNAVPFLDLHQVPLVGKPRDPAGQLWDLVFPEKLITY
jgi:D-alanine-D-alanine ligase-like ATP-grasp enzyme